ncbi:cardiolipin synthase [Massilia forsythiae]|uniref:Cardiolipin synthase n=1 Tax=Massilia forsythiae TaxID=2728020 RepID=A0A7Z2VVN6_9BURK|nr:cardiolipin synthase [Massilia forsythiae]QJE00323.1 cardiolipin synthase [Massilia forsythiae]
MRVKRPTLILITCIATIVAGLLVLNFAPSERKIESPLTRDYDSGDPQFRRSLGVLLGPPIVEGNKVDVLINGDQIFPAMLKSIREAQHSINFETYIYWSGTIGKEFSDALSERARAGVKVNLLLDWIGSIKIDDKSLDEMRRAGVEVHRYHKPVWWKLAKLNNRTHRKLLVVDGRIGFTGGVGIADKWRGNGQDEDHWRDSHFRVEGPVVGQVQAVFNDNWLKATGKVLDGEDYFPALKAEGTMPAQMFSSSPTGGSESMHLMYLMAINAARHTIHLSNSYFVPDDLAVNALVAAAKRGVDVRIITPGEIIDSDIVRAASRERWGKLLRAGIKMAEYQPTMYHVKALVVDSLLVSVGSTNFDNRSFSLNDEANLNVFDHDFANQQESVFEDDWAHARPITLRQWEHRPMTDKIAGEVADLIGSQL